MRTISAHCDNCGAPLEIPARAKRITCLYCDSGLEVLKTEDVITTAVIEKLHSRVNTVEDQVEELKLRQRLHSLDVEWQQYRQKFFKPNGKGGIPSAGQAFGMWIVALVSVVAAIGISPMFLIATLLTVIAGFHQLSEADKFNTKRTRYRGERRQIVEQLGLISDHNP